MANNNNLSALLGLGQSPWYDNIDRRLINNGKLKKLFDLGITGVTSNPSIFEKAVRNHRNTLHCGCGGVVCPVQTFPS